ncbi:unnamed protein product [Cuscuta epithymum]|uniref:GTD-binding domain-containing protein n=1 Tax=Cuscuta epithymum TaxID=186058 RepID=A0AAV0G8B4_9ASTE|nr:unnamed protein product [Cuscuta epithymum]
MTTLSFRSFAEQNVGRHGVALIYAALEFFMIVLLLLDGFLAFFSTEFAKLFELRPPCVLCTRIDRSLVHHRNLTSYWSGSVCEDHKRGISSLAYCHAHKMLSDIRTMCEGCLLSFGGSATSCDRYYKSLVGFLHKDIDCCFVVDNNDPRIIPPSLCKRDSYDGSNSVIQRCSCCGELLRRTKYVRSESLKAPMAPPHTPQAWMTNTGEISSRDLPLISCTDELKWISNGDDDLNGGGETSKPTTMPLLPEPGALHEEVCKTPSCSRLNKFFGIPLSDSSQVSPRWCNNKKSRKMSIDFLSDLSEMNDDTNEGDDDIVFRLKRQVLLERRSLMSLYMELDEERSASAVAANNAMAMITRLQAEKAAVQMEALQHQRMMEEHADYYREELQVMRDLLLKTEEEVKVLETELEMYRDTQGAVIYNIESEICEVDADEDYQRMRSQCISPFSEISMSGNRVVETDHDRALLPEYSGLHANEDLDDSSLETERSRLLSLLSNIEKKISIPSDEGSLVEVTSDRVEGRDPQGWGNEKNSCLTREMSSIRERLRTIEAESDFIKHAAMTMQRGDEGIKLLTEISDNLRKLRAL